MVVVEFALGNEAVAGGEPEMPFCELKVGKSGVSEGCDGGEDCEGF